jgi:hypothetical protein
MGYVRRMRAAVRRLLRSSAIHVADSTRRLLGDGFIVEERGLIGVKGKGKMRTHDLVARADAQPAAP